ncbi:MAG: 1-aminocyclopropane-1-carboxylate deaminase [Candidatus Poriferisodalaceae bacterium]|jgi:1-aminocyclopropane-1-carboxylate deaminase/D-cysteine desulfhydrase-like pyridoxal-dependent ACC family enzyme
MSVRRLYGSGVSAQLPITRKDGSLEGSATESGHLTEARASPLDGRARHSFAGAPTPLQVCDRLGAAIGLAPGQLLVKRDDLTCLAAGGNKARKLEFLVADAIAKDATVLVTGGAAQSNHVRATAAAASMSGLRAVGVVGGDSSRPPEGNITLDHLLGLELVWAKETYGAVDLGTAMESVCERLRGAGERPYPIPLGGSSPVGALGYVIAADELSVEIGDALVYVADGTGGTHAGLVAGFGDHDRVVGVDVGAVPELESAIIGLASATAKLAGRSVPNGSPTVRQGQVGEGYGRPTAEGLEALRLAARLEGLVLDPVYTAKGMAGLIADGRSGSIGDQRVVFIHTGGLPGLLIDKFATWIRDSPEA